MHAQYGASRQRKLLREGTVSIQNISLLDWQRVKVFNDASAASWISYLHRSSLRPVVVAARNAMKPRRRNTAGEFLGVLDGYHFVLLGAENLHWTRIL